MTEGSIERNWAGNHTYRGTVRRPRTVAEVQELVAATTGTVHALGSRHSFSDAADAGTLVALDALDVPVELDEASRTVRVGAGVRYGELAGWLHERGWALHNLASLPHISVAGAVATGTHGSGDRHRGLADAVTCLDLVTADGELLPVRRDAELAGAVVGVGALGVVTALTLRVEPTYDVLQEVHTDLPWDAALTHLDDVLSSADSVSLFTDYASPTVAQVWRKSRVRPGWEPRPDLFGARPADGPRHPLAGVDPVSTTTQGAVAGPWHERWPHFRLEFTPSHGDELQSEYLVDRRDAPAAIEALRGIGQRIAPLLLVAEIRSVAADDLWLSPAHGRATVALHLTWQQRVPEVTALLPELEEVLAPFAPRPHWGKLFTADVAGAPAALRAAYPRLDDFRALAARLDPQGRFHNDFLLRHGLVG
ncbi:FAD-binding protein [Actinotalea sp. AC32]|nr:FAD-binding protein [Actinotalea sp. AC32]